MEAQLGNLVGKYGVRFGFVLSTLTTPLLGTAIVAVMVIYPLINPTGVSPELLNIWWAYLLFGGATLLAWLFFLKDALKHYAVYENGIVEKPWLGKGKTIYFNQLNGYTKNHVGGLFGLKLYHYFFFAENPNGYGKQTVMQISSRYKTDEKLDNLLASKLPDTPSPFLSAPR